MSCKEPPEIVAALPAVNWVAERAEPDGSRSVLPIAGWAVYRGGQLKALPLTLDGAWTFRPKVEGDDRLIRLTAARIADQNRVQA